MSRWTMQTLDGAHTYVFPINPNAQDSPLAADTMTWLWSIRNAFAGVRTPPVPVAWTFSGVLRTQQQYDDLLDWVITKRLRLLLVTDLPETLIIRLTAFLPDRTAPPHRAAPWRHSYSMKALVFSYYTGLSTNLLGPPPPILGLSAPAGRFGNDTVLAGPVVRLTLTAPAGAVSLP